MDRRKSQSLEEAADVYSKSLRTVVALRSQGRYCPTEALEAAQADERETYLAYLRYVKMVHKVGLIEAPDD